MKFAKQILLALALVVAFAGTAGAQASINSSKFGTEPNGLMLSVFNTTDSTIVDGSVVCADTTGSIKHFGVRNWLPASQQRYRVVGIAVGRIPGRGTGKVLLAGYHPRVIMNGLATTTAFGAIEISLAVNGSMAPADSAANAIGYTLGYNAGVITGTRYTAQCFVRFTGPYGGP